MVTKHLIISGRVQGVGYRASAYYMAKSLRVTGWVCNLSDGTVEAMVQGSEKAVGNFIAWARQGPDAARVEDVQISDGTGKFDQFTLKDTI